MKIIIKRTTSDEADFQLLAAELEAELKIRDGDDHLFYAQLNKVERLEHAVVAYNGGEPVGCGAFRALTVDSVEIKRLFVRPANRGQGVAGNILTLLEGWAVELGYRYGVLETGRNQPEALALYKKYGYTVTPNFGKYVNNSNSICFKKTVIAPV